MKRALVSIALIVLGAVACAANPARPTLRPVAERWRTVSKGLEAPVVLELPGMDRVRTASVEFESGRSMDLYYPADFDFTRPAPAVVFVMGYSSAFTKQWFGAELKDLGQYVSWGQLVAASGMIGIAYETDYPDDDLDAVLSYLRGSGTELGIDSARIGLFACSGNTLTALGALAAKRADYRDSIRCGVIFYPVISYFMNTGEEVMPAPFKRELRADLPIFMVTVGKDRPEWKEAVSTFLSNVEGKGYPLEVAHYEQGVHGFDTDQDTDASRAHISHALAFLKDKLY